jgi:hypothetical protein
LFECDWHSEENRASVAGGQARRAANLQAPSRYDSLRELAEGVGIPPESRNPLIFRHRIFRNVFQVTRFCVTENRFFAKRKTVGFRLLLRLALGVRNRNLQKGLH